MVSPQLVNFGGAIPSAVIGAHSFYVGAGGGVGGSRGQNRSPALSSEASIFVGENRADAARSPLVAPATTAPAPAPAQAMMGDPAEAMFVGADGTIGAGKP